MSSNKVHPTQAVINKFRADIQTAATDSARAEAALVAAESAQATASADDGTIDPAKLYERTEAAKRATGIAQVTANRAAAKLAGLEEDFIIALQAATEPLIVELNDAVTARKAELEGILNGLRIADAFTGSAMEAFIGTCTGVADRLSVEREIRTYSHELRDGQTSNFVTVAEKAIALLAPAPAVAA